MSTHKIGVAASLFADKWQRSNLSSAIPLAVAYDVQGRQVAIPPEIMAAGPDAVAEYLRDAVSAGLLGDRVSIRAKRFLADNLDFAIPDDDDRYGIAAV